MAATQHGDKRGEQLRLRDLTVRHGTRRGTAEVESGADRARRGGVGVQWVGQSDRRGRTVRSLGLLLGRPVGWAARWEERGRGGLLGRL